jgi:hypothetical protein
MITGPTIIDPHVLNILQRINAVQKEVAYIQKDRSVSTGGGSYKAVSHDAVTALLRPHLIKHGIVYTVTLADECHFDQKEEGSKQRLFRATFTICFASIDKPEDRIFVTLPAHALDNGDKAPGKAISYATKYALLKVFALETGEDEESRYKSDDYDFAAALEIAEGSNKEEARALLLEARQMAIKLKDPAAAKAISAVGQRLAKKFADLEKVGDQLGGQA